MTGSSSSGLAPWLAAVVHESPRVYRTILVIEPRRPLPDKVPLTDGVLIVSATLAEVDFALLSRLRPDMVLAPLMTPEFDILDLARRLSALAFRGQLRAYAQRIPDPRLVQREIASACPGLDFDLIVIGAS